jgi:hypothetical protein
MKTDEAIEAALKFLLTVAASSVLGAFIANAFAKRREQARDADGRRRQFRAFLSQWHAEFLRIPHTNSDMLWDHYTLRVPSFQGEAERCKGDFIPDSEFRSLCSSVAEMRYADIFEVNREPRDVIVEALRALMALTALKVVSKS